jgi:hypothetical protein
MQSTARWQIFDSATPILTYEYSFGPGESNSLAVGCREGLVVVSPPCRAPHEVFDDLARYGEVRALVAPNAFHHLGLPAWKARWPGAEVFAPAQAVARVQKHSKLRVRPIVEATSLLGDRLDIVDMPHYKTGELLVRIRSERGLVWYVTDVIMNMPVLPHNPIAGFVFKLSGSAPGLRFNNIAPMFMVRDKSALRRWITEEFRRNPPDWLIAAHGDAVDFKASPHAARDLFGSAEVSS